MPDILPDETLIRRRIVEEFREICRRYRYEEVETPIVEPTNLYTHGVGDDTDVVSKEMYSFLDAGGRSLSLRPEGTAGAVRAAIDGGLPPTGGTIRWSYVGPMFRAEKPAKGRFRQFTQMGVELYGDSSPESEAEAIEMATRVLTRLGIQNYKVRLNTLGKAEDRAKFKEALKAHLWGKAVSPDSQRRLETNPLRILDSKDPRDLEALQGAPSLWDFITSDDWRHFEGMFRILETWDIPYQLDAGLVRGLDYYQGTVFEITDTSGSLGAADALGGGGRYDGLFTRYAVEKGPPAFGFALGLERLALSANLPQEARQPLVAFVAMGEAARLGVMTQARAVRALGIAATVDTRFPSLRSQMRRANDTGADVLVVIGAGEMETGKVTPRWLREDRKEGEDIQEMSLKALCGHLLFLLT